MRYRNWIQVLALALLSSGIAAGCGGSAARHGTTQADTPAAPVTRASSAWPEEKLAKAHAHYGAGVIHEMNDEEEQALNEYYLAALNDPENAELVLEVSRRFVQKKEFDEALEVLTLAASRPAASGAIYARLGMVYNQVGKTEQAIEANRTAIKRSPDSLVGYQNLFTTLLQNKREQEALKILEDAAALPKLSAEFLVGLAELYQAYVMQVPSQKAKVQPKALAALNRAEKLNPENPLLRLRMADDFNVCGDTEKASQMYLDLLKRLPDVPPIRERLHAKLATIYLRDSNRTNALEQLRAIIRDNPTNPQAYYYLGFLTYSDKKPAEAAEYFSKAIVLNPDFAEAYCDLALCHLAQDKPAEALNTLATARKKFSENFALEFYTALAYGQQREYAASLKHLIAAEVIAKVTEPKLLDRDFYFQLGACYERTGDYARAEECFEKCLALAPDWPEALNYLGYMWADRGQKLDRAREMLEKAVKAEPKNAAFLDSLAWVLFRQNLYEDSLRYALLSIDLSEKPDPTLFDHLGDIYAALNQPVKAMEAWNKALELEPNDKIRKKLNELKSRH